MPKRSLLTYQCTTQPCWSPVERGRLGVELFKTKLKYRTSLHPRRFHVPRLILDHCHVRQTTNTHYAGGIWHVIECTFIFQVPSVCAHRLIRKSSVCFVSSPHSSHTVAICHGWSPLSPHLSPTINLLRSINGMAFGTNTNHCCVKRRNIETIRNASGHGVYILTV